MILAALFLSIFSASGKSSLNVNALVFLRFFSPLLLFLCISRPNIRMIFKKNALKSFIRSIFAVINQYTFFISVKHINLLTATTLVNTAPFFILLVSVIFFYDQLNLKKIFSAFIGFAGIVILLQENQAKNEFNFYFIFATISGFCWGMSNLMLEYLLKSDSNQNCMFYYFFWGSILTGGSLFLFPANDVIESMRNNWWIIIIFSVSTLLFQFFTGLAYKMKSSTVLSPYLYLSVLFSSLIGFLLFQENFTVNLIMGATFVMSGAILSSRAKSRDNFYRGYKD